VSPEFAQVTGANNRLGLQQVVPCEIQQQYNHTNAPDNYTNNMPLTSDACSTHTCACAWAHAHAHHASTQRNITTSYHTNAPLLHKIAKHKIEKAYFNSQTHNTTHYRTTLLTSNCQVHGCCINSTKRNETKRNKTKQNTNTTTMYLLWDLTSRPVLDLKYRRHAVHTTSHLLYSNPKGINHLHLLIKRRESPRSALKKLSINLV
jgi:hypothetical protein